jgi:transposase
VKRFIQGQDRNQSTLFPESLEEYIEEDNTVRVVDAYVDELDLLSMGFERVQPKATGRPGYHPSILLKLYIYGYLNCIQSSRRLEREAGRNVELMWLTGKLAPDFKTIADFRKDNGPAIQSACSQFVTLCRELGLFARTMVAIDGAKFKAVNAREKNFTRGKLTRRIGQIEHSIEKYLHALDATDLQEGDATDAKTERLKEKITSMREKMAELKDMKAQLVASPKKQISLTDPDSVAMATSTKAGMVGYNVQTVVDTEHHLIVAHEVTNIVSDKVLLTKMTEQGQAAIGRKDIKVFADRGYFSGAEIMGTEKLGATTYVPKPYTSGSKAAGCPVKAKCTTGKQRRIKRWVNEDIIDAMLKRLNELPEAMAIRRATVEHPFGTLKSWMGVTHFLTKRLPNVKTEMSLSVLAYNIRRMISMMGVKKLIRVIQA